MTTPDTRKTGVTVWMRDKATPINHPEVTDYAMLDGALVLQVGPLTVHAYARGAWDRMQSHPTEGEMEFALANVQRPSL